MPASSMLALIVPINCVSTEEADMDCQATLSISVTQCDPTSATGASRGQGRGRLRGVRAGFRFSGSIGGSPRSHHGADGSHGGRDRHSESGRARWPDGSARKPMTAPRASPASTPIDSAQSASCLLTRLTAQSQCVVARTLTVQRPTGHDPGIRVRITARPPSDRQIYQRSG
jgi:hypothetical protein